MSQDLTAIEKTKILVVDDHPLILSGTVDVLQKQYPNAEIITANTAREALERVEISRPQLVVIDLSIPEKPGVTAQVDTGMQLLQNLVKNYPELNLMVQSCNIRSLVRIKHDIDAHQGGFTVADKGLSQPEMLKRVDWALQGITYTKDLRTGLEVKPEWLEVLRLAFEQGLQDEEIANRIYKSKRMVRHYWTKVQDVLNVYPDEGENIRVKTGIRAREEGFID
jgi:DNA-binding NarL/FixJ family response regulator